MKNFHEVTEEEFKGMCDSKKTWADIKKEYKQPDWCDYPEALDGIMGCWSLTGRKVKKQSYCIGCPEYKS
jgi:hypothetical protein